jgi:hypothetical protein
MQSPELARELRAARPAASADVRERVLALASEAEAPSPPRFTFPSFRRLALVAAPAAFAVLLGIAVIHGITSPSPKQQVSLRKTQASGARRLPAILGTDRTRRELATPLPAAPGRLSQYTARLRVQVKNRDELSDATKRAMRVARLLGGYVAAVHYSSPHAGLGSAELVVRVPVDHVQDAIEEYSALGTLLAQNVRILDVTKQVQEAAKEIARLKAEIASIEAGGVTPDERPRLEAEQARLDFLVKRNKATVRRAELARISLGVVTKAKAAAAKAGRFHRTLSAAGSVLVREAEILLYALIVAGPLLLLGAALVATGRLRDRRLFERV